MTDEHLPIEGGCLCGRVRFQARAAASHVSYCHCRMCQKATGGPFSVTANFPRNEVTWQGEPVRRRSSPFSVRGFCGECGTPLLFEYDDSPHVCIAVGAFDDPEPLRPLEQGGIESRLSWAVVPEGLPSERCDDDPDYRRLVRETGWTPPFDSR